MKTQQSSIEAPFKQLQLNGQSNTEMGGGAAISTKSGGSSRFGNQSELLQQLSEVGGLRELSVDPGQLVENGTVQGHTGHLPLCTAAAVPTDLETQE